MWSCGVVPCITTQMTAQMSASPKPSTMTTEFFADQLQGLGKLMNTDPNPATESGALAKDVESVISSLPLEVRYDSSSLCIDKVINAIKLEDADIRKIYDATAGQRERDNPLWHKIHKFRLTAITNE